MSQPPPDPLVVPSHALLVRVHRASVAAKVKRKPRQITCVAGVVDAICTKGALRKCAVVVDPDTARVIALLEYEVA